MSTHTSEQLAYIPIRDRNDLREKNLNGVGCVVMLVNRDGNVYVLEEKKKGWGINVPTETRKEGEYIMHNVFGALAEEVGSGLDLRSVYYVRGLSYLGRMPFPQDRKNIHGDVVMLFYAGDEAVFESRNEVTGIGFESPTQLMERENLREAVRPSLELLVESGSIQSLLDAVEEGKGEAMFARYDPEAYVAAREEMSDLVAL